MSDPLDAAALAAVREHVADQKRRYLTVMLSHTQADALLDTIAALTAEHERLRDDMRDASRDYQRMCDRMEAAAADLAPHHPDAFKRTIAELKSSVTYAREIADAPSPTRYVTERLTALEKAGRILDSVSHMVSPESEIGQYIRRERGDA